MKPAQTPPTTGVEAGDRLFLPDFCTIRLVLVVMVIAELLAIVLVLAPGRYAGSGPVADPWAELGLLSLFIQWVALCSAGVLCLARRPLHRVSNVSAALVSYLLLLGVTAVFSELAWWTVRYLPALLPAPPTQHLPFLLRNLAISAVISAVALRYLYVQHQWKQQVQAEALARIESLQARIRPHFLFNSLNTIAALIPAQPEQAEEAVQDLSDLFRATLGGGRERVYMEEEIEIAQRYVHMESLRLGARLQVVWELAALPLDLSVPPLIIQPLLENAIYHGIEPRAEGGTVRVSAALEAGQVRLQVSNPLPPAASRHSHQGKHMALDNIRQRLALAFGPEAGLAVEEGAGDFLVSLFFPARLARETTA